MARGWFPSLLVLLLALVLPATGAAPPKITFTELQDPVPAKERERVVRVAETMAAFHSTYAEMPPSVNLKVRLFRHRAHFRQHWVEGGGDGAKVPGAYYSRRLREMVVHQGYTRWPEIMVHEVAHHFNKLGGSRMPTWLEEGLAEFFESGSPSATRVTFRPNGQWLASLRSLQRTGRMPDLREFFSGNHRDFHNIPEDEDNRRSYGMAYTVVYFLMSDSQRRSILTRTLGRMRAGEGSALTILDEEYPGGVGRLQRDWEDFLRRPFPHIAFTEGDFTK